jgi:hypothetical protein
MDTVAGAGDVEERPAGVTLLNVRTWHAYVLAADLAWPVVSGGTVLATGRSEQPSLGTCRGDGVLIRSPDGRVTRTMPGLSGGCRRLPAARW